MTEPLDAIKAIYIAFRHDMDIIDAAALDSVRGNRALPRQLSDSVFLMKCWSGMHKGRSWPFS